MAKHRESTGKVVTLALLTVSMLMGAGPAPRASAELSQPARATTSLSGTVITVTTTADELNINGECSLREAIQASNTDTVVDTCAAGTGGDTIILAADSYTLSIEGRGEDENVQGDLDITGVLTITGTGATTTVIQGGTETFNGIDRVLNVLSSGSLTVQDLQIRHGYASFGSIPHINGGGIYVADSGFLSLENCIVTENWGANAGGVYSAQATTVHVNNSIISNNESYSGGGGLHGAGTVSVRDTTFRGNKAIFGGALRLVGAAADIANCTFSENLTLEMDPDYGSYGGAIANYGSLIISSTTFYSNTATNDLAVPPLRRVQVDGIGSTLAGSRASAADGAGGGAISNGTNGTVLVINSTFSDNSAVEPKEGGAILNAGTITITNSTFSNNLAAGSGTLANHGTLILTNTIVTNSIGEQNCSGSAVINGGHNIDSGITCGWDSSNGSMSSTDPQLRVLALNTPGTTETHALPLGSPAVDAGDSAYCPATDQRGVSRPFDGNGDGLSVCDIGAYECIPLVVYLPVVIKQDSLMPVQQ